MGPDWPGLVDEKTRAGHGLRPGFLQGHIGDVNPGDGKPWIGDPAKIHEYNRNFLSYMGSFEDIEFVTGSRYIQTYLQLNA